MKQKKVIWSLFDKLKPIINAKLLNPDDKYVRSGAVQLVVPALTAEEIEILPSEEVLTALPSDLPNIWYVYPDVPLNVRWKDRETYLIITLKTDDMTRHKLTVSLTCYGCDDVISYGNEVTGGNLDQIMQFVNSNKFPGSASSVFKTCVEAVAQKIEKSEQHYREVSLFAHTDISNYDSVMKFVNFLGNKDVLKSKGYKMSLLKYNRAVSLLNTYSKCANVLVDKDGKARFCRLDDFPTDLLNIIRRTNEQWNLEVYDLSVGQFNCNGQALVIWIISPYSYCPMDEDGFGEEENFEVAVTCHINTRGHLTDTPVLKPYSGRVSGVEAE